MDYEADFPNINTLPSLERIPSSEIETTVRKFEKAYNLPSEVLRLGLNSEVFLISKKDLTDISLRDYQNQQNIPGDIETYVRNQQLTALIDRYGNTRNKEELVKEAMSMSLEELIGIGGLCLPLGKEASLIYIVKDSKGTNIEETKEHEIAHALSRVPGTNEYGFSSNQGTGQDLNEAATEIIALGLNNPKLGQATDLGWHFVNSQVNSNHQRFVFPLGYILGSSKDRQMTLQDIANHFFRTGVDAQQRRELFREDLLSRLNSDRDYAARLFDGLVIADTK